MQLPPPLQSRAAIFSALVPSGRTTVTSSTLTFIPARTVMAGVADSDCIKDIREDIRELFFCGLSFCFECVDTLQPSGIVEKISRLGLSTFYTPGCRHAQTSARPGRSPHQTLRRADMGRRIREVPNIA